MLTVKLPTAYLPNIAYFACLEQSGKVFIEAHEHYVKQSYRNRTYILTANGVIRLTIPVIHHGKVPIQVLEIDYRQRWQLQQGHRGLGEHGRLASLHPATSHIPESANKIQPKYHQIQPKKHHIQSKLNQIQLKYH